MKIIAMIPARYSASRFPGKLMQDLAGKSVILRTYEATVETNLFSAVYVVTDSDIISNEIKKHGGNVIISQKEHESGSDRIAEAVQGIECDIVVNVQGDEPFTEKVSLQKVLSVFKDDQKQEIDLASLMVHISDVDEIQNPNSVKVIVDQRNFALYFSRNNIPFNDIAAQDALQAIELRFKYNSSSQKSDMYLNGENVEQEIREMQVSSKVSEVATIPAVRAFAVAQQKAMGIDKGIVMDGRDIGTVVFPDAELKLFMTADVETRAKRRQLELLGKGEQASLEEIKLNLETRDEVDSNRTESPLLKVSDAIEIDTSSLTFSEQVEQIIDLVKKVTLN